MSETIYLLCAAVCVMCAVALLRGYRRSGNSLLIWSGICFLILAVSNTFLCVDLIVFPEMDFQWTALAQFYERTRGHCTAGGPDLGGVMTFWFFLLGIGAATFAASGLFFFKFWHASRDRFFLFFASACWLMALERTLHAVIGSQEAIRTAVSEASSWVYLFRLLAFILIFVAAVDKNR